MVGISCGRDRSKKNPKGPNKAIQRKGPRVTSINDQRIRKLTAIELVDHLPAGVMFMPEHKLLVHMLVRAYLDYYLYKEGVHFKQDPNNTQKTKRLNKSEYAQMKTRLNKIDFWIHSDKIHPFSFMWICQNLEEGDGTGLAYQFRESLKKERSLIMTGGHFKRYSAK